MDSQILKKELIQFEHNLWCLNQYSRILQEFRDEIAIGWDDSAAKYVNGKYLNPLNENSSKVRQNLNDQYSKLYEMENFMALVTNSLDIIYKLSHEIERLIQNCKEDIKKSYSTMEDAKQKMTEASLVMNQTQEILHYINLQK